MEVNRISVSEASQILVLCERQVRRLCQNKTLKNIMKGNSYLIEYDSVIEERNRKLAELNTNDNDDEPDTPADIRPRLQIPSPPRKPVPQEPDKAERAGKDDVATMSAAFRTSVDNTLDLADTLYLKLHLEQERGKALNDRLSSISVSDDFRTSLKDTLDLADTLCQRLNHEHERNKSLKMKLTDLLDTFG